MKACSAPRRRRTTGALFSALVAMGGLALVVTPSPARADATSADACTWSGLAATGIPGQDMDHQQLLEHVSETLDVSRSAQPAPYSWSTEGRLPPGERFTSSPDGVATITGSPLATGHYLFDFTLTDSTTPTPCTLTFGYDIQVTALPAGSQAPSWLQNGLTNVVNLVEDVAGGCALQVIGGLLDIPSGVPCR
ncbi:MAG: hypothetical protein FWE71_02250 [Nocardioidaceae bacterium]|nr:hypothetical protein [Nocardioidaceae bacterium]MCL2611607.1 hypothetical protein [Nocardioidaceae bacterium]